MRKAKRESPVEPFKPYIRQRLKDYDLTTIRLLRRKVSRECFVSYQGNKYSVPWKYATRECLLRIRQNRLLVEVAGEVVAEHDVQTGERQVSRVKEHFQGLLKITREAHAAAAPRPRLA